MLSRPIGGVPGLPGLVGRESMRPGGGMLSRPRTAGKARPAPLGRESMAPDGFPSQDHQKLCAHPTSPTT
jgi:hypothetical protein